MRADRRNAVNLESIL
uniref:Uncharacterized protein n=1 Tax=Arundo donax TaxID=35708 RepID=A0A0A8Z9L2_ARUDO